MVPAGSADMEKVFTRVKRLLVILTTTGILVTALTLPSTAVAKNCGRVAGTKVVTYGGLSCKRARTIFRAYKSGKRLPSGWSCAASAGSCWKSKRGFTFRFN
jgi:hypothetical protein